MQEPQGTSQSGGSEAVAAVSAPPSAPSDDADPGPLVGRMEWVHTPDGGFERVFVFERTGAGQEAAPEPAALLSQQVPAEAESEGEGYLTRWVDPPRDPPEHGPNSVVPHVSGALSAADELDDDVADALRSAAAQRAEEAARRAQAEAARQAALEAEKAAAQAAAAAAAAADAEARAKAEAARLAKQEAAQRAAAAAAGAADRSRAAEELTARLREEEARQKRLAETTLATGVAALAPDSAAATLRSMAARDRGLTLLLMPPAAAAAALRVMPAAAVGEALVDAQVVSRDPSEGHSLRGAFVALRDALATGTTVQTGAYSSQPRGTLAQPNNSRTGTQEDEEDCLSEAPSLDGSDGEEEEGASGWVELSPGEWVRA